MKGLMRLVGGGFALLLILLAGFFISVDHWAGAAIERGATYALGVDTGVGFVRVSFILGTLRVSSLEIDNPPGFDAEHLIEIGSVRLAVPPATLREPVVAIPIMEFDSVRVSLEKAGGATNYGIVLANLKRFEASRAPAPTADGEPEKRFIVKEIVIRNIHAHVEKFERLGNLAALNVTIPEVLLRDVGADNAEGVAMEELTNVVVKAVFTAIVEQGVNLPATILGGLRGGLGGLTRVPLDVIGGAAWSVGDRLPDGVRDSARKLGDGASAAGRKALDGLGRIFGRDRNE